MSVWSIRACIAVSLAVLVTENTRADSIPRRIIKTRNYVIHTDLPDKEAKELLEQLEVMHGQLAVYFRRKPIKPILGYVVVDLNQFQDIPQDGAQYIRENRVVTNATRWVKLNKGGSVKSVHDSEVVFYAVAQNDVALHEAVHAFIGHTFESQGPAWYREGVAEIGQYWRGNSDEVQAQTEVIRFLQLTFRTQTPSLLEVTNERRPPLNSWQDYALSWSLCHLLMHHPRYSKAIHELGTKYMSDEDVSFEEYFGRGLDDIMFEWRLFVENMEAGYRVDLCHWEWKESQLLRTGGKRVRIEAARGWQPTGVRVREGEKVELKFSGKWKVAKDLPAVGAEGNANGRGRVVGICLQDRHALSQPFEIGHEKEFDPPASGHLYLRCQDDWGKVSRHSGAVSCVMKPIRKKRDSEEEHPDTRRNAVNADR